MTVEKRKDKDRKERKKRGDGDRKQRKGIKIIEGKGN